MKLAQAKARIELLEAQLKDREAVEDYLRSQIRRANEKRDEDRRRRLDLETEFELMGYVHITRPKRRAIKKRIEKAWARSRRKRGMK
jgi:hypothetical protein